MNDKQKKEIIAVVAVVVIVIVIIFFLVKGCTRKFTVDFDSNGGTAINSLTVEKDGTITRPADPTREGYIFDGWYLNGEKFDFNTKITGDMKLEARWVLAGENGITLSSISKTLKVNELFKLGVTLTGDAKNSTLVFTSSDETIATVDQNGNIKALKPGKVTITVKTKDGKYEATCQITITEDSKEETLVTSIKVTGKTKMTVGNSQKLKLTIKPTNATNKNVTWTSSDKSIATVDQNGNVKALKPGKVTITATAKDGSKKKGSITITVEAQAEAKPTNVKVTSITISGNSTMKYGASQTLKAMVKPDNATNKSVTWSVSNGAKIDQNGKITITGDVDEVIVTATAKDGSGVKATYKIKVEAVYAITFTAVPVEFGDSLEYTPSVARNGKPFSNYNVINYNGYTKPFKDKTVKASNINKDVITASIILKNGTEIKNVSVSYK